jgi:hypothetical protein
VRRGGAGGQRFEHEGAEGRLALLIESALQVVVAVAADAQPEAVVIATIA